MSRPCSWDPGTARPLTSAVEANLVDAHIAGVLEKGRALATRSDPLYHQKLRGQIAAPS
jgi:hypothetical protein